jgi:hypothetical protein
VRLGRHILSSSIRGNRFEELAETFGSMGSFDPPEGFLDTLLNLVGQFSDEDVPVSALHQGQERGAIGETS